ncbi:bifunctional nuclease family protein [Pseudomarimonas salicorniae]|uniref:Bifunctional nuclease family protein n=1 Tax=Pseudomarimonas salicorniae TaxID=2933270 RepID=A0ABT0GG63_9GAMM|nr:bifunctional nuclease family protein [Lysobacter sp. CAU 1642]MCK7593342.1 bifunctional nuclease family protein [Lysobacter sp. CAU 1642]
MPAPLARCLLALCLLLTADATGARELHASEDSLLAAELIGVEALPGTDLALIVLGVAGRQLPMFTGLSEASAILRARDGLYPDRPQTHELLDSSLREAGWRAQRVMVDLLDEEGNFHAVIELVDEGGRKRRLDSRPSDAIALALRAGARLYVARDVLDSAAEEAAPAAPQIST